MLLTCVSCRSLGAALGFTVNILEVWSSNGGSSRARASVRTLISFISEDRGKVVPSEDVTQRGNRRMQQKTEGRTETV
ncbi:hypothetical protein JOQ06_022049 [Pogonophryne albipinna]|uniref:Secreted protein n=1 Tax=Pogonophryne albipinna TaxID=1090488 RepID=A0AAD6ABZ5_9TELE|nr:hypothetical protein JOQ06_022037 [Pogonophryne albipinna]KAJ4921906.1 hypothetical protein JOQ06_022049 [Pogonophryne albipinna]